MITSTVRYISFPRTVPQPPFVEQVVAVFAKHERATTTLGAGSKLKSDGVLALLRDDLLALGFQVEAGKQKEQKIRRPVFFGEYGKPQLQYQVDAYWPQHRCGLEIEAARAVGGNAIYRDLLQALVMVEVDHLFLAVPLSYVYGKKKTKNEGFKHAMAVAEALYGHTRIRMPYALTVIGY
ncbi:MAG TPA: hypothetical protein VGR35_02250 [Tepidisphaeraceae bacterium]|nr:hypothetical protein [Tepidisphaeraceae bacterium]